MKISIHTLCEEGDLNAVESYTGADISIHTLCEEGDVSKTVLPPQKVAISIHTLCEEGDESVDKILEFKEISIHTLCEEGDHLFLVKCLKYWLFQSTPSVKRATFNNCIKFSVQSYFNPHPL